MHWNNFSSSTRVAAARVEEDDEHRHDDEEAQGPQEVVQEDVHLCAAAVIWSLPDLGKMSSEEFPIKLLIILLGWIVIHWDPGSAIIKFCGGVQPNMMIMGQITVQC